MEQEPNDKLPFLDAIIIRTDTGKLEAHIYWKPTNTDQTLNYSSDNPRAHKTNCIQTLFKKARTQCNTLAARKSEEKCLKIIFQKNDYSINLIKKCQPNAAAGTKSSTETNKGIIS